MKMTNLQKNPIIIIFITKQATFKKKEIRNRNNKVILWQFKNKNVECELANKILNWIV